MGDIKIKFEIDAKANTATVDYNEHEAGGESRWIASADSRHGLPGADTCSNDWHRNKFVATDSCPDCEMTVNEVNTELRNRADQRQSRPCPRCKKTFPTEAEKAAHYMKCDFVEKGQTHE